MGRREKKKKPQNLLQHFGVVLPATAKLSAAEGSGVHVQELLFAPELLCSIPGLCNLVVWSGWLLEVASGRDLGFSQSLWRMKLSLH